MTKLGLLDYLMDGISVITWDECEEGFKTHISTVGIDSKDIKVSKSYNNNKCCISIKGETTLDDRVYSIDSNLYVVSAIYYNIEKILKRTINGITIIKLVIDKDTKSSILVEDF